MTKNLMTDEPTQAALNRNLDRRRFNKSDPLPEFLRLSECINFRQRPWFRAALDKLVREEGVKNYSEFFEKLILENYPHIKMPKYVERGLKPKREK